ncbi:MAG: apolipoprotein N-acyltransferase, partial [Cyanobacteria bacterium P01_A01_bin.135]
MALMKSEPARLCLLGLGGLAMGLTAAPVGAWPLAWIALAPLWIAVVALPPKRHSLWRAARYGFLWGFLYGGVTVHWLWFLHPLTWMGVPWLASLAIAAFCWGIVAVTGGLWIGAWAGLFSASSRLLDSSDRAWGTIAARLLLGLGLWAGLDWVMQQGILYWPSLAFTQSPVNLVALHLT